MPDFEFHYFADSGYAPWGGLSESGVLERSEAITDFLVSKGCENIVVACNTATSQCISHLRSKYSQRFFGIEPAIKPAGLATKTGSIGLLATDGTLNSERVRVLISKYSANAKVELLGFPGVVELIEGGESISKEEVSETIDAILNKFREKNVDTIVLGCTHYRYFYEAITQKAANEFNIVEPVKNVAKHIANQLSSFDKSHANDNDGNVYIYTSSKDLSVINKYVKFMFSGNLPQVEYIVGV